MFVAFQRYIFFVNEETSAFTKQILLGSPLRTNNSSSTFVCFHVRPRQATDVLQPAGLLYRPLWTFQRWPPDAPRAYRRVPHSSGGSWNLRAGIRTDNFAFVSMGIPGKPRMYCSLLAYCTARFGRSNFGHQMPPVPTDAFRTLATEVETYWRE
jgi:hypothetical protein